MLTWHCESILRSTIVKK
jgi:hypothetical protein